MRLLRPTRTSHLRFRGREPNRGGRPDPDPVEAETSPPAALGNASAKVGVLIMATDEGDQRNRTCG